MKLTGPIFSIKLDGGLERGFPGQGLVWAVFRRGRLGGVISFIAGAVLLWGHQRAAYPNERMAALGIGLLLFGGVLALLGNGHKRALRDVGAPNTVTAGLHQFLSTTPLPFVFCTGCRSLCEQMHCGHCASQQHTMQACSREDVELIVTVLEAAP